MDKAQDKLLATSRRSAANEASLIWSLVAAAIIPVVLFLDVAALFWPLKIHPFAFSAFVGVGLGWLISRLHYFRAKDQIDMARAAHHKIMEEKRAAGRSAHLAELEKRAATKAAKEEVKDAEN